MKQKVFFLSSLCIVITILLAGTKDLVHKQASAQQTQSDTQVTVTLLLHGIGNSGDNLSPNNIAMSTKYPSQPLRMATVNLYNTSNQLILSKTGKIQYYSDKGAFVGNISLGANVPSGTYIVKVKVPSYLWKRVPGTYTISSGKKVTIQAAALTAGDINNDNAISILDYNILMGCYSDLLDAAFCSADTLRNADLSADSEVNALDYNLFLREILAVQRGE